MTERDWLTTDDVNVLLRALSTWDNSRTVLAGLTQIPSDRKLLLLMAAWCREIFGMLRDSRCKRAVRVAELFADGLASEADRASAGMGNVQVFSDSRRPDSHSREYARSQAIAWAIGGHSERPLARAWQVSQWLADDIPSSRRADLLRHVVGNPFEKTPMAILSLTVVDMARALSRGVDSAVGPLHDSLEECGAPQKLVEHFAETCPYCKDAEFTVGDFGTYINEPMRKHLSAKCVCRGSRIQWHPKGCWALDAILGLE